MTPVHTPKQVSADDIREILDGLEGVTPGPWTATDQGCVLINAEWDAGEGQHFGDVLIYDEGTVSPVDAAHIARCDPDTMRQVLTLALDALTRRSSAGVKVIALEWNDLGQARSAAGLYSVSQNPFGWWWSLLSDGGYAPAKPCATKKDAQAAAQVHFNTRILSALEPATQGWIETEDDGVSEKLSVASELPSHAGEDDGAVGEAGSMPGTEGFTMAAFNASDVPVGTKLYLTPSPTLEPSDAEVERACRAFIQGVRDQDREWSDETDEGETSLIAPNGDGFAVFLPIRAAIIASRQPTSGEGQ